MIELISGTIKLRCLRDSDAKRLATLCNNKKVWDNLRDYIPFPYTEADAFTFIDYCHKEDPQLTFAIEFKGKFVGCIGLVKQTDIYKHSAEIGYWLGEPYWGLGIATEAVNLLVDYGFNQLHLIRIYSGVIGFNKASQRVMEKAGFKLEAIFEKAIIKNETLHNEYRYSKICDTD